MAVVKIVPMPGVAVVGPMGAQGPIGLTGPAGTNGTNGTNGADGSQLNYWDGSSVPQDPAEDGFLIVDGIVGTNGSNILVSADDRVFIGGNNGEFLNGLSTPENQIATIGDLTTPTSGTWNVNLNTSTYTYEESSRSSKTFAEYYLVGDLVHFDMNYCFENQTNGGFGYLLFDLPFLAKNHSNNILFTGVRYETEDPLIATGQVVIWGRTRETHPATGASGAWVEINYEDPSSGMSLTQGLQRLPINSIRFSGVYRKA